MGDRQLDTNFLGDGKLGDGKLGDIKLTLYTTTLVDFA